METNLCRLRKYKNIYVISLFITSYTSPGTMARRTVNLHYVLALSTKYSVISYTHTLTPAGLFDIKNKMIRLHHHHHSQILWQNEILFFANGNKRVIYKSLFIFFFARFFIYNSNDLYAHTLYIRNGCYCWIFIF